MDAKTKRWTLRVTPAQDMIVRQVVSASGMSLSEYVVSRAVASAVEDLADRRVFAVSGEAWEELQAMLDRPGDRQGEDRGPACKRIGSRFGVNPYQGA